jgi:hypothetical protein
MPLPDLPQADAGRARLSRAHAAFVEATDRLRASPPDFRAAVPPLGTVYRDDLAAVAAWHRLPPEPDLDLRVLGRRAANFASGLQTPVNRALVADSGLRNAAKQPRPGNAEREDVEAAWYVARNLLHAAASELPAAVRDGLAWAPAEPLRMP